MDERFALGDEDVETSQSRMSVAREVEIAIRPERGEHLVASGIHGFPQILDGTRLTMTQQTTAPDVESSHPTRHIADEVEPFAIRTDSGVGIAV